MIEVVQILRIQLELLHVTKLLDKSLCVRVVKEGTTKQVLHLDVLDVVTVSGMEVEIVFRKQIRIRAMVATRVLI